MERCNFCEREVDIVLWDGVNQEERCRDCNCDETQDDEFDYFEGEREWIKAREESKEESKNKRYSEKLEVERIPVDDDLIKMALDEYFSHEGYGGSNPEKDPPCFRVHFPEGAQDYIALMNVNGILAVYHIDENNEPNRLDEGDSYGIEDLFE